MITDDELFNLPEDKELAFLEIEQILLNNFNEEKKKKWSLINEASARLEYMSSVMAAVEGLELDILREWEISSAGFASHNFGKFLSNVKHHKLKIRIKSQPRNRRYSVSLDGATKTKIHHYIHLIKTILEESELSEEKKESLYKKINDFINEVDKNRTGFQAGMALLVSMTSAIGEAVEKLEPARKWVDSIAALLGKAKEAEEALRPGLPTSEQLKRLAPPEENLASPQKENGQADDLAEIPF